MEALLHKAVAASLPNAAHIFVLPLIAQKVIRRDSGEAIEKITGLWKI